MSALHWAFIDPTSSKKFNDYYESVYHFLMSYYTNEWTYANRLYFCFLVCLVSVQVNVSATASNWIWISTAASYLTNRMASPSFQWWKGNPGTVGYWLRGSKIGIYDQVWSIFTGYNVKNCSKYYEHDHLLFSFKYYLTNNKLFELIILVSI